MSDEPTGFGSPPEFSLTEARDLVHERYGISGFVQRLTGEESHNFRVQAASGEYVLKISPPHERLEALDLENRALDHLNRRWPEKSWPRVLPTSSGEVIGETEDGNAGKRFVRLFTYLSGELLVHARPHSPALLKDLGRFFGVLDHCLKDVFHSAATRTIQWDLRHASRTREYARSVTPASRRSQVEILLHRFAAFAEPVFPDLRTSVIHNDGNDHNVLVQRSAGGEASVVGIIDFGDMVHTCTVFELAVAASYALLDTVNPLEAATRVVEGYHETHPLMDQEIEILFHLICARLAASVCIAAHRKRTLPAKAYLQVSQTDVLAALDRLAEIEPTAATRAFREACRLPARSNALPAERILEIRRRHLGKSLSVAYRTPLQIVRGSGPFLFADSGRPYLDMVNNVCHVGHCHPRVVEAAQRQIRSLNTNTRYLHENLARYAERLSQLFPDPLGVCFFVCSGSEANDLALRLALAHSQGSDVIVVAGSYHGATHSMVGISPYKFDGPGGTGAPAHVHVVAMPDPYRGRYGREDPQAGEKHARDVSRAVHDLERNGRRLAAFYAESLLGVGGQIVFPPGYLESVYRRVRNAGGVCVADEVQVGFGRVGSHFWGFQTQGVVPDIVTLGKPMGNGHPIAAVITTPEIASSFATGMEYFNTYGGNPVSCAVGLAVLDVIEAEELQERARRIGGRLKEQIAKLQKKHRLIGDVRGMGLFLGIELVTDQRRKTPATDAAAAVVERMLARGILLSTDGPFANVLKIKPPMVLTAANADEFVTALDEVFCRL